MTCGADRRREEEQLQGPKGKGKGKMLPWNSRSSARSRERARTDQLMGVGSVTCVQSLQSGTVLEAAEATRARQRMG